ncbi:MAG: DUF4468 domain-containing protein [Bacteroidales bacterium]|nr:DUF4468 domain-containing protein [Bacteroidales bacterium]
MKRLSLFVLFISVAMLGFAQKKNTTAPVAPDMPIDDETQLITYKEVIQENGTAKELYARALNWAKSFYHNPSEVIKEQDDKNFVIKMRGSVRIYSHLKDGSKITKNVVYYNFTLQCREGRYRYTITDFNEKATAACPIEKWLNPEDTKWDPECYLNLQEVDEQIQALLSSLVDGMQPVQEKEDEW